MSTSDAAPGRDPGSPFTVPEVEGILSSAEVSATVDAIGDLQLPNGMIQWFPGGHADPWNHVEAAMALAIGGRRVEAERAYRWLAELQRPDGSWHQYYLADGVEQDKLDANTIAYIAAGTWHHWLLTKDTGFVDAAAERERHGCFDVVPRVGVAAGDPRDHAVGQLPLGDAVDRRLHLVGGDDAVDLRHGDVSHRRAPRPGPACGRRARGSCPGRG